LTRGEPWRIAAEIAKLHSYSERLEIRFIVKHTQKILAGWCGGTPRVLRRYAGLLNLDNHRCTSVLLSKTLIFRPYDIFSIGSFEPAHSEMAFCGLLEMLDK
jgi:hypothetical protein